MALLTNTSSTLFNTSCVLLGMYHNTTLSCSQLLQQFSVFGTRSITRFFIAVMLCTLCVVLSIWTCIRRKNFPLPIHNFYYLQFTIFSFAFYGLFNMGLFTTSLLNNFQIIHITPFIELFNIVLNLSIVQLVLLPAVVKLWLIGQSFYINKLKSKLIQITEISSTDTVTVATKEMNTINSHHWIQNNASQIKLKQIQRLRFISLKLIPILFVLCSVAIKIIEITIIELAYVTTTWIIPLSILQKVYQGIFYVTGIFEFIIWPLLCIVLYIFIAALKVKEPFCLISLSIILLLVTGFVTILLLIILGLKLANNIFLDMIVSCLYYCIDISMVIAVSITALVPIIQTYSKRFNNSKNRTIFKSELDSIHSLLDNYKFYKKFYEFSVKEWSNENLIFLQSYKTYFKETNIDKKWFILQQVFEQNMVPNAPLELNIANELVIKFNEFYKQKGVDQKMSLQQMDSIMENISKEVLRNILDILGRFKVTKSYNQWKMEHESNMQAYTELGWSKSVTQNM